MLAVLQLGAVRASYGRQCVHDCTPTEFGTRPGLFEKGMIVRGRVLRSSACLYKPWRRRVQLQQGARGFCEAAAEHLPCVPPLRNGLLQALLLLVKGDAMARLVCRTRYAQPLLRPCNTLCV
ncbi:hypothetical protein CSUI_007430, partial [Cystoisospora suis]